MVELQVYLQVASYVVNDHVEIWLLFQHCFREFHHFQKSLQGLISMTLKQTADDEMKYLVKEFLLTNILYNKTKNVYTGNDDIRSHSVTFVPDLVLS